MVPSGRVKRDLKKRGTGRRTPYRDGMLEDVSGGDRGGMRLGAPLLGDDGTDEPPGYRAEHCKRTTTQHTRKRAPRNLPPIPWRTRLSVDVPRGELTRPVDQAVPFPAAVTTGTPAGRETYESQSDGKSSATLQSPCESHPFLDESRQRHGLPQNSFEASPKE